MLKIIGQKGCYIVNHSIEEKEEDHGAPVTRYEDDDHVDATRRRGCSR